MQQPINIFWFRRDLRLHDNAGLYHALRDKNPVLPVFIFDSNILDQLEDKDDRRVAFIHATLVVLQEQLVKTGSTLKVYHDKAENAWKKILSEYKVEKVFANHDYEPYAIERDARIEKLFKQNGASLYTFKDQVIFEKKEVIKDDGTPYTVFTPYSKRWKNILNDFYLQAYPTIKYHENFFKQPPLSLPSLMSIGFKESDKSFPPIKWKEEKIKNYSAQRDFPALDGTTKMGVHLRFGTISIRELASEAMSLNETYLNELIWRDFYQMILWHFQRVGKGKAFKPAYEFIQWRNNEVEFEQWCKGQTGYPIVDAGMRELNETGYMHNRVRMIVASFLSKHLLIDWRWGEAYFAKKLLDFDLAANNGGWQWAAGCGCDAAPYFRIFNPYLQTQKFDPELKYIRRWVPELEEFSYPKPIVDHDFARKRCQEEYGKVLKKELF